MSGHVRLWLDVKIKKKTNILQMFYYIHSHIQFSTCISDAKS